MNSLLATFTPKDFVAVFPSTSKDYIVSMLDAGSDPIAIATQLASEPSEGLAPKGAGLWPRDLVPRLVNEIHVLLCTDDPKYATIRDRLKGEATTSAKVVVYLITSAVAASAGMAPALCVPFVALILAAIAKVGLTAWCQAMTPSPLVGTIPPSQQNPS